MENVKNNTDRKINYIREYKRYNTAIKNEFYLEAIAIVYAIIEDRLVSFLHHAGIVSRNNENLKITNASYPYIRKLMGKEDSAAIRIKDISVKMNLIMNLLNMDELQALKIDDEVEQFVNTYQKKRIARKGYMHDIYCQISRSIDREKVQELFMRFEPWRDTRNKLIHALLNKTAKSSEAAKEKCAKDGYLLSRQFDDCLAKPFYKNNTIRKKYKIQ